MALFGTKKSEPKKTQKTENVLDMAKDSTEVKVQNLKENTGRAHHVLKHYHLSEKSNAFSQIGRYVFRVHFQTNKIEVKKAIESVYDVHVTKVNMITVTGKKRRHGKTSGHTSDWKKAIVTLKDGERISGLAEGV